MSPIGPEHESVKSTIGALLEAHMREGRYCFTSVEASRLNPRNGFCTPDEFYAIGTPKEIPDIVIEVIVTSGRLNKKELYRPRQVPEVVLEKVKLPGFTWENKVTNRETTVNFSRT